MDNIYKYFFIEADEILENISINLVKLSKSKDKNQILNNIFRYAHTLKGASQVVGIEQISKISHSIENIFSNANEIDIDIDQNQMSLIFEALDLIKKIIISVKNSKEYDNINIEDIVKKLNQNIDNKSTKKQVISNFDNQIDSINEKNIPQEQSSNKINDSIRVNLSNIDKLLNLSNELLINSDKFKLIKSEFIKLTKYISRFVSQKKIEEKDREVLSNILLNITSFDTATQELKILSENIYQTIYKTRAAKISSLSHYFVRIIDRLAQKLNKKVDLIIKGDEIEIDKNLIDAIKEPVNQLLRNAIIHGVEKDSKRKNTKKPEKAKITIKYILNDDFIIIDFKDDGHGIDIDKVKQTAVEKGLINQDSIHKTSYHDALKLILHPGFSTKNKEVTQYSGRGMGLDIVNEEIKKLHGEIDISTEKGAFTCFKIKIPLALNIINSFCIMSAGQKYLIPINHIKKTGYLEKNDIKFAKNRENIISENIPVPLIRLNKLLNPTEKTHSMQVIPYLLIQFENNYAALCIDSFIGIKKVLNKDIGTRLKKIKLFSGGAILDDGTPSLILNIKELFNIINKNQYINIPENISTKEKKKKKILAVDDSLTSRILIKNILDIHGYNVITAKSGKEAMNMIDKDIFNLFILDVEMPEITGFQVADAIRKDKRHKKAPIIILSSLSNNEHKKKGVKAGIQAYITKGNFNQNHFLDTVKRLA